MTIVVRLGPRPLGAVGRHASPSLSASSCRVDHGAGGEAQRGVGRGQVAEAVRSLVALDSVVCVDPALLLRAAEVYETDRIDFADAYLVACAESTGVGRIASFARSLDRVPSIERVEPPTI